MSAATARFTLSPNICSTSDEDGSTILDIQHDKIYSVVGVSSLIWQKLADSGSGLAMHSIIDDLSNRFQDVSRRTIEADVSKLLESFRSKGMIVAEGKANRLRSSFSQPITRTINALGRVFTSLLFRMRLYTFTAFLGIASVNLVLRLLRFQTLCEAVKQWPINDRAVIPDAREQVCEAVKKAASWYPRQSMCLQRSAVTTCLLRQSGVAADLVIGCRKIPFGAHAWVEVCGEVANDKRQVQTFYKVLTRL
ncbi:MAG TPA: lasso peptide biosynthesis B2 protein [Pyrinomonadaceae bacterium]|nr:lasso peptide biosynthesis B2 protein [Pyrinomonadaceae bacterium]